MRKIDSRTRLPAVVKQPIENRVFSMDFSDLLVGLSLASVDSVTATNQNLVTNSTALTVGSFSNDDTRASVRLSGGTAEEHYKISIVITDSGANVIEGDGMLLVEEL